MKEKDQPGRTMLTIIVPLSILIFRLWRVDCEIDSHRKRNMDSNMSAGPSLGSPAVGIDDGGASSSSGRN